MRLNQIILYLTLIIVFLSSFIFNQSIDFKDGFKDGVMAAESNSIWYANCCLSFFYIPIGGVAGIAAAYIYDPTPSKSKLVGKNADYIMGFNEGYKLEQKKLNQQNAWRGFGIGFGSCISLIAFSILMDEID